MGSKLTEFQDLVDLTKAMQKLGVSEFTTPEGITVKFGVSIAPNQEAFATLPTPHEVVEMITEEGSEDREMMLKRLHEQLNYYSS